MSDIEQELRLGKMQALRKAEREIYQAWADLARNEKVSQVNRWATYLSVPVSSIEAYFGLLPVAGVTMGIVGTAITLYTRYLEKKNNWLQLLR